MRISREKLVLVVLPVVLAVAVLAAVYFCVDPAPRKRLVISTGEIAGSYQRAAEQYSELIRAEGVTLESRPSKGAWENLKSLQEPNSGVDVAFVQDGLGSRQKNPDLSSLGSIFYEPIWIFYRGQPVSRLAQLRGARIAVGEPGGETHTMAKKLLAASGVDAHNSTWIEGGAEAAVADLIKGQAQAAFFVAGFENSSVQQLLHAPGIQILSLDQAEAITRQIPYLHHLILPHGTVDLARNWPAQDIDLVAPTATLLVRNSLHPALVYLLLKAATKVHHAPGVFEKRHEFPTDKDYVYPLNSGAKNFYQSGAPFWLRYLPFWLAVLVQRFIFLVIPMAALVIPILRTIPKFLQWRVRNRIYQRYGELKFLESQIRSANQTEQYGRYLEQLDAIDDRVSHMKVPLDFSEYVYSLRGHIQMVRDRLHRLMEHSRRRA